MHTKQFFEKRNLKWDLLDHHFQAPSIGFRRYFNLYSQPVVVAVEFRLWPVIWKGLISCGVETPKVSVPCSGPKKKSSENGGVLSKLANFLSGRFLFSNIRVSDGILYPRRYCILGPLKSNCCYFVGNCPISHPSQALLSEPMIFLFCLGKIC